MAAKKKVLKKPRSPKTNGKRSQGKVKTEVVHVAAGQRRRGAVNKAINQAVMRERIAARRHDTRANNILIKLREIYEEVSAEKVMTRESQAQYMTRIAALRTELDGHFKFLNKYLPDQRSVELTDPDGNNPLEQAARAWAKALQEGL